MAGPLGPADLQAVYGYLVGALSQDPAVRLPAEAALNALEPRVGFCSCLTEIIAKRGDDVQHEARWLASVYFKNSITRFWRQRRDGGVTAEEKLHLRPKVLQLLREESQQVAIQLALIVAKIARLDYPKEWPDLFPGLLGQLASADALGVSRVYLVLHHVLKELSSKRLVSDQKNFAEITAQLFEHVWGQWQGDTQTVVATLQAEGVALHSPDFRVVCDRWRFCLKALRRLICFGYGGDAKTLVDVPAVATVLPVLLDALQAMLPYWVHACNPGHPLHKFMEKSLLKLITTTIEVQQTHPWSCRAAGVMDRWLEFCTATVVGADVTTPGAPCFVPLLIQCQILLQNTLRFMQANHTALGSLQTQGLALHAPGDSAPGKPQRLLELRLAAKELYGAHFTPERVFELAHVLLTKDFADWSADPEAYYHEQDTLSFKDSLRPCAETLLLALMQSHRELLGPRLLQYLQVLQAAPPSVAANLGPDTAPPGQSGIGSSVAAEVLNKEACYNAFGHGAYELHDYVDFAAWFHSHLAAELADRHSGARVVRRRAAWMLGCWVAKVSEQMRPMCYHLLIALLEEPDFCVQLSGVNGLRALVEDWNFYEEPFLEFAGPCFERLFKLLNQAAELDSQLQVFNLIYTLIDRLGDKVKTFAGSILEVIPALWEQAEGQSLLRVQLVQALQKLMAALGADCRTVYPILLPLLTYCTDPNCEEALNLLEDGLQLWHEALQQAPAPVPELLNLFPNIVTITSKSTEHVKVCLGIIESNLLLQGRELLQLHGQSVINVLSSMLGAVNERGTMLIFPVLDTLLQIFPAEGPSLLEPVLLKLMGTFILAGQESDMVVASACGVFARILLHNTAAFGQLMANAQAVCGAACPGEAVMVKLMDTWLDKSDSLCTADARKLTALALTSLLTMGAPQVLERLADIFSMCSSVVYETEGDPGEVPNGNDYWVTHGTESSETDGTPGEGMRKQQLSAADPVSTLTLRKVLHERLNECYTVYGQPTFTAALNAVDPSILKQLQECTAANKISAAGV